MSGNITEKEWQELLDYLVSDEFHSSPHYTAAQRLVQRFSSDETGVIPPSPMPQGDYPEELIISVTVDAIATSTANAIERRQSQTLGTVTDQMIDEFLGIFEQSNDDVVHAVLESVAREEAMNRTGKDPRDSRVSPSGSTDASSGSSSSTKHPGIRKESPAPDAPWRARIRVKNQDYYLISTSDPIEAAVAYVYVKKHFETTGKPVTKELRDSDIYNNFDTYLEKYPELPAKMNAEIRKIDSTNKRLKA